MNIKNTVLSVFKSGVLIGCAQLVSLLNITDATSTAIGAAVIALSVAIWDAWDEHAAENKK